jgi:YesN/AraC family two-component response regulator
MNVLLVDDERIMLKMMKIMLQSKGFQIFDAGNGRDALMLAQNNKIDLLITDVVLDKDLDGFALARRVVMEHPNIPVLFMSGFLTDFEANREAFGRCAFLQKPFQKADLVNAIAELAGTLNDNSTSL